MSRTAAFAVFGMLALFGGGESSLIFLVPLSLGKQAQIVNGLEAGRIPEPALEHIPAAVSLIIYSSHYGHQVRQTRGKNCPFPFVPLQKHHACGGDSGARGFISPTSRLSITDKFHYLKIEVNFIILMLEALKAVTPFYC
jgi:hypothetical protein